MAPVTLTADQLSTLQTKVQTLVADKGAADQATTDSSGAHATLQKTQADAAASVQKAQTDAANADQTEAKADGQVQADLADLQAFIDNLAGGPANAQPPTPAPAAPAASPVTK